MVSTSLHYLSIATTATSKRKATTSSTTAPILEPLVSVSTLEIIIGILMVIHLVEASLMGGHIISTIASISSKITAHAIRMTAITILIEFILTCVPCCWLLVQCSKHSLSSIEAHAHVHAVHPIHAHAWPAKATVHALRHRHGIHAHARHPYNLVVSSS